MTVSDATERVRRLEWPSVRSRLARWAEPIGVPIGFVLASTFAHLLVVWAELKAQRDTTPPLHALAKWDGGIYLRIARDGYPSTIPMVHGHYASSSLGFFPLYPLVVRVVYHITPWSLLTAGVVTAVTCSAAAAVVLWHLTARLVDRGTASRAVALFAFAPGAFVLSMTYSEPLFLLLACSCLLFLNARRWELAGVCALLACLTRPNGLAVVAACATAAVVAVWQAREWRALVAPALAAVGFVALPIYDRIHTGDALAYWRTQRDGWHQGFDFGANTVRELGRFLSHPTGDVNRTMSALAIMVIAGGLVLMARWRPPLELWAYTIVILGMALTTRTLTSSFRFTMTAFPLTIAYARVLRREAFTAAVAVSAVLFAIAAAAAAALIYTP